jgi:hypothetical protein
MIADQITILLGLGDGSAPVVRLTCDALSQPLEANWEEEKSQVRAAVLKCKCIIQ